MWIYVSTGVIKTLFVVLIVENDYGRQEVIRLSGRVVL